MAARGAEARAAAARVVDAVLGGRSLDDALAAGRSTLPERDQPLLAELAYGACRWQPRLDFYLGTLLQRGLRRRDRDLRALLLVGLYQLHEGHIPAHAALSATSGAAPLLGKRWATGLVNGVLRNFQRRRTALERSAHAHPPARWSLPPWLLEALQAAWPEQAESLFQGLLQRPAFTLRVNRSRVSRAEYAARLAATGLTARPVPGVPSALMLDRAVPVTRLPGFAEGVVSVQDAGAQLAAGLLDARSGMAVLDACAAPGGKSGHLLERTPDLRLTCVDLDPARLARVEENLARLGRAATLYAGDAAEMGPWSRQRYDRILLDVPCSATGVLRRHPDIRQLRRADDLEPLVRRQAELLARLWRLLRPGGKLLYATCSLLPRENEAQVVAFVQGEEKAHAVPLMSPLGQSVGHGVQLLPLERETDGFYYALLEKR